MLTAIGIGLGVMSFGYLFETGRLIANSIWGKK